MLKKLNDSPKMHNKDKPACSMKTYKSPSSSPQFKTNKVQTSIKKPTTAEIIAATD